jgi:hypothetical protein
VAIGAPSNNDTESGHVRIFNFDGSIWTQVGQDIDGEAAGDSSGSSVSLSADGSTVAIGSIRNDGNGADSGHVRVYNVAPVVNVTLIPDPVFEQYLIDESIDTDGIINGQVFTADIENVTSVNVNGLAISDLTGIEDFVALEELFARDTDITSIDVSANSSLKILSLTDTQIAMLNVSANIALETLDVTGTQLTSLDVSNNTALQVLLLVNTPISNIDVSMLPVLTVFRAQSCPNLSCIGVADEAAANAGTGIYTDWLKDAIASYSETCGLTFVPDDIFEQYLVDQGYDTLPLDDFVPTANIANVTSVNVDGLAIFDLTGIEDFTALINLDLAFNQLSSLDVTNNTLLETLTLNNPQISSLDVTQNTVLTALNVSGTPLNAIDVTQNLALQFLFVNNTNITAIDVTQNTQLLQFNTGDTAISNLDLSNNTVLASFFNATNTPNLNCIGVADETAANAGSGIYATWQKDATTSYSENCSALSVVEFNATSIYVGPNPMGAELTIELNNTANLLNISLFDITGKKVLSSTTNIVSVDALEKGIYMVKVTTDKGSFIKKLVKN